MLQSFINVNQSLKKITDKKFHIYNIKECYLVLLFKEVG